MTTFRALREQTEIPTQRTVRLPLPPSSVEQQSLQTGRYGEYMAQFRGALVQLFGEPYSVDGDAEYVYFIEARDSADAVRVLKVIQGSSGPSIRGEATTSTLISIAEELRTLVETTKPADFEVVVKGTDARGRATYGCRNGVCYWRET